jgi:hypothetical protein
MKESRDPGQRLGLFHHISDYAIAIVFLMISARANNVVWPVVIGAVALLNAASTQGPLAAYRTIPRRVHGVIDFGIVAAAIVGAIAVRNNSGDALGLVALGILQLVNIYLSGVLKRARA